MSHFYLLKHNNYTLGIFKINNILQYQNILQNLRSLLVQSVELFSERMYRYNVSGGHADQVIFHYKTWCIPLEAFASENQVSMNSICIDSQNTNG